ncbi:MAG: hypothetical protein JNL12_14475 [Planctomycetes bacterium]|nr:hypothetical protein [Planctomycetota bacterium]
MRSPAPFVLSLLALGLAAQLPAQLDVATFTKRRTVAEAAVQQALADGTSALQAVRDTLGDPNHKLQGTCDDIANALRGGSFEAGIGSVDVGLGFLDDYVAEELRPVVRSKLTAVRDRLAAGSLALLRFESLTELVERGERLQVLGPDDDATGLLADLAASAARATRSAALERSELAQLQQFLQQQRQRQWARRGQQLLADAEVAMATLRSEWPEIRTGLRAASRDDRDRAQARFDEAYRNIGPLVAEAPVADGAKLWQELTTLQAGADAAHAEHYGAETKQRLAEAFAFTADSFTGWEDETGEITATGYLDFDPPSVDRLGQNQTINLVERCNLFLAFAGTDADAMRARANAELAAFVASIRELRQKGHEKLLRTARLVVEGLAALEIQDERHRGRLVALADWDLPLALQNHPEQAALVGRIHAVLDAHAKATLGDAALATIRTQAASAADALWPRFQQWLPVYGGFAPAQASLFVGRTMRLDGVWMRTAEFEVAPGQVVFDLDGHVFVGTLTPALAEAVRTSRTRLQLAPVETLDAHAPCELLATIGEPTEVRLLGPKGREDAIVVTARAVRLVGVRQEAVFAVAP